MNTTLQIVVLLSSIAWTVAITFMLTYIKATDSLEKKHTEDKRRYLLLIDDAQAEAKQLREWNEELTKAATLLCEQLEETTTKLRVTKEHKDIFRNGYLKQCMDSLGGNAKPAKTEGKRGRGRPKVTVTPEIIAERKKRKLERDAISANKRFLAKQTKVEPVSKEETK
jgi:hypothetical protein